MNEPHFCPSAYENAVFKTSLGAVTESSPDTRSSGTLILNFLASITVKKKSIIDKLPILLQQHKQTKTIRLRFHLCLVGFWVFTIPVTWQISGSVAHCVWKYILSHSVGSSTIHICQLLLLLFPKWIMPLIGTGGAKLFSPLRHSSLLWSTLCADIISTYVSSNIHTLGA